ncbi:unnamed protein product [Diamesa serratosioi]
MSQITWEPEKLLNCAKINIDNSYAVIVLNRPINADSNLIESLWRQAKLTIAVDGGANRWIDWLKQNDLLEKLDPPQYITGDFDSARKESLDYFKDLGTEIISTPDQDATDFTKSLMVLEPLVEKYNLKSIIVFSESSGRFDQILANINTLFIFNQKSLHTLPVFLLSANSMTWLLSPANHSIHIPELTKNLWCALIPIGSPCVVSTKGLKWNLTNNTLEFGGIVSTSNTYDGTSKTVEIITDKFLLWSMGISKLDDI